MKKIFLLIGAVMLACFHLQAQTDSLQANRRIVRSTLYGAGVTNLLDTYLSPLEYTGTEIRVLRENMRSTRLIADKVMRQSLFQANLSLAQNKAGTGSEFAFLANWNLAYLYQFPISGQLKFMAGPHIDVNGGMIYNLRNSNNPVNVKAYANLGASGMAIYRFHIKEYPFVLRYQLNLPLLGMMFSPEYGQPYYEMSLNKDFGKNIRFTSLHNQPSMRQFLTLDFPIRRSTLRVGYIGDIQQARANHLKSHAWSHAFMLGFVKHFQSISQMK